jgi:hypothetical protein
MKNTTNNIIRTAAVILTLMITTANFAHAGNPVAKTTNTASKQVNPNFDPNKKTGECAHRAINQPRQTSR